MAITQDRLRNLVEESERNLTRMAHMWQLIENLHNSPHVSDSDKLLALYGNAKDYLCARDCTYTILERERIKLNWKRNERTADKVRRMRERRAQGLGDLHISPPRKPPQQRMFTPEFHPMTVAPPKFPSETPHAFTTDEMPNVAPQETPSEPSAYDIELARARELGEQERARNAERLAHDPFASGD